MSKLLKFLFKKQIDKMVAEEAEKRMRDIILDDYITKHFTIASNKSAIELQFHGEQFIKYMAACVYELVKDTENFVETEIFAAGYEPILVTIQKRTKKKPTEIIRELQEEVKTLKGQLERN